MTEKEKLLELVSTLDESGLAELRSHLIVRGRPRLKERSESIGTRVELSLHRVLFSLAMSKGTSVGKLVRELILLGLPEMTGKSAEELIEEFSEYWGPTRRSSNERASKR